MSLEEGSWSDPRRTNRHTKWVKISYSVHPRIRNKLYIKDTSVYNVHGLIQAVPEN